MKARIVYASMTGNDADMAEILEEDLQDYGFEVETSEASFTDASDYLENDLCIFITYTYGEGKMTDDVADFYDQLKDLDLSGKYFAVMGSGDKMYADHFCENVFDFEKKCLRKLVQRKLLKQLRLKMHPMMQQLLRLTMPPKKCLRS